MRRARAIVIAAILALGLMACQAMFTTSLGTAFERTSVTIPADISAADAQTILDNPETSPAALAALLDVLNAQAATSDVAAGMAVDAAIGASGVAESLAAPIMDAATAALGGGTPDVAGILASLRDVGSDSAVLTAFQGLGSGATIDAAVLDAANLSPTDLALVALVIAVQGIPGGITDPTLMTAGEITTFQATPQAQLAAALLAEAATGLTDTTFLDALSGFLPVVP